MQHRFAVEALDRTLPDVLEIKNLFVASLSSWVVTSIRPCCRSKGFKISDFGCLPQETLDCGGMSKCISSKEHVLGSTPESEAFAKYLLEVGAGKNSNHDGTSPCTQTCAVETLLILFGCHIP